MKALICFLIGLTASAATHAASTNVMCQDLFFPQPAYVQDEASDFKLPSDRLESLSGPSRKVWEQVRDEAEVALSVVMQIPLAKLELAGDIDPGVHPEDRLQDHFQRMDQLDHPYIRDLQLLGFEFNWEAPIEQRVTIPDFLEIIDSIEISLAENQSFGYQVAWPVFALQNTLTEKIEFFRFGEELPENSSYVLPSQSGIFTSGYSESLRSGQILMSTPRSTYVDFVDTVVFLHDLAHVGSFLMHPNYLNDLIEHLKSSPSETETNGDRRFAALEGLVQIREGGYDRILSLFRKYSLKIPNEISMTSTLDTLGTLSQEDVQSLRFELERDYFRIFEPIGGAERDTYQTLLHNGNLFGYPLGAFYWQLKGQNTIESLARVLTFGLLLNDVTIEDWLNDAYEFQDSSYLLNSKLRRLFIQSDLLEGESLSEADRAIFETIYKMFKHP